MYNVCNKTLRGFQAVTEMLQPIPPLLLDRGNGDSIATDFDVGYISTSANVLLAQVGFQTALESYSNDVHTSVVTDLEKHALAAETSAWRTQLLLALTMGQNIGLSLAWSPTNRALQRNWSLIKEIPEQYLWSYKRFKVRPQGKAKFY